MDSEHIVTSLLDRGYDVVDAEQGCELVVVNTCGFIDAARDESLQAIDDLLAQGSRVVVTGCLGAERAQLTQRFPQLEYISGPADVAPVLAAVEHYQPRPPAPDLMAQYTGHERVRLTPDHYAYLKISEGCNHKCSFCIIPSMRGKLNSRGLTDIVQEAHAAVENGAQELLLIAQDLSAYGLDLRYESTDQSGESVTTDLYHLVQALGGIAPWLRLHYVYPYPSVDKLIPLMAEGKVLPYLDMPLQHAAPGILKAMRRPAAAEKTLERLSRWREICPELSIRSTFIVGFPGETEEDVGVLLDFLSEAQLDRVGCFTYSPVDGARANALDGHLDERDKLDRQESVYELQAGISASRLQRHIGSRMRVLVDSAEGDTAQGRSQFDAPEIDGVVYLDQAEGVAAGEFVWANITAADAHDLHGDVLGTELSLH